MTRPHSQTWAPRIEPHVREYVQAVALESVAPMRQDVSSVLASMTANDLKIEASMAELKAKMNVIEELLKLPSYKVAKLLELADKD